MNIKNGDIVQSPRWAEPVQVSVIAQIGDFVQLIGVTTQTNRPVNQLISQEEFDALNISKIESNFTADARQIFLSLEALRYHYASLYDPLLAVNTSDVDPLPHQVEAVYGYVLKLPRVRFLIADDPGAGKTIMAGLIIKELKLRHLINRILIVAPGHLKDQWRREMKERFSEYFVIIDRGLMGGFYGENVWQREAQLITSIDFAKREEIMPSLASFRFDLVIVDEAHKMSAYRYGEKTDKTSRYRLGEMLSQQSEHLLFLTATPHKGDQENFRLFLDLLEPGAFATTEMINQSITAHENPLFIRRTKENLKNFNGEPLFPTRYVKTVSYNLGVDSQNEMLLYRDLSTYVQEQYNKALSKGKKRNVAFALVILQRRFASSTYAVLRSLERRRKRLSDLLDRAEQPPERKDYFVDLEEVEDLSEEERWKEEELWETLSVAENRQELRKELTILEDLIRQARTIIEHEEEIKLRSLKETLDTLNQQFPGEKVLIFTESFDTLTYLEKRMRDWGYQVNTIHGKMSLEERIKAEGIFKHETQVLIATEAAGEGINLQFCHLMINYDIPWNPNRLEQRMGRVHRYGQDKEVFIYNLVAEDTREGMVFARLFEKIEEIRKNLGSDKVFDVLGDTNLGKTLAQLLLEAATTTKSMDEILKGLDIEKDDEYLDNLKDALGESLATHFIDYSQVQEMRARAKEYRLSPEYTEAFFKKAFDVANGRYRERKDGFLAIETVPVVLRKIAETENFRKHYGELLRSYTKVSFDKEQAFKHPDVEFITFGHPLFEAILRWIHETMSPTLKQGAVFEDPDGMMDGVALFYEGEIRDGAGNIAGRRLFACFVDQESGRIEPLNPAFIWDLAEIASGTEVAVTNGIDMEALKRSTMTSLIPMLADYRGELLLERERQAIIKEKYSLKSLDHLILKLDGDLIDLYARREQGENVDLPIRLKEEQKQRYELALEELQQTTQQQKELIMNTPNFVGAIRIVPARQVDPTMKSDREIEWIGMEVAMRYEREQGRDPEDVSARNLGFDIRSVCTVSVPVCRYIEVKARAGVGAVSLTKNEWFIAERFQDDYYLYVVLKAANKPELIIIQNPTSHLQPEQKIDVRYLISVDEIRRVGYIPHAKPQRREEEK